MDSSSFSQLAVLSAIFIAVAALFLLLLFISEAPRREALERIAKRFSGKASWLFGTTKGVFQGTAFSLKLIPGGASRPPRLLLQLFKGMPFSLRVYRENSGSGFAKSLGIAREVRINDSSFDSQFRIFSSRPVQAVHFLSVPTKNILRELFSEGFGSFRVDEHAVSVLKANYVLEQDLEPERVERLLRRIISTVGGPG